MDILGVTIERDDPEFGGWIVSDTHTLMWGWGATPWGAVWDYLVTLFEWRFMARRRAND